MEQSMYDLCDGMMFGCFKFILHSFPEPSAVIQSSFSTPEADQILMLHGILTFTDTFSSRSCVAIHWQKVLF